METLASMKKLGILLLLASGCATGTASVRRMAEYSLKSCLKRAGTVEAREECGQESATYCLEHMAPYHRIEKGCGLGWN